MNKHISKLAIAEKKMSGTPITMLTAYDYSMAKLLDENEIDMLLVGDSLGNVMLGYESTLPVTMEDMIHHTKIVAHGARHAMVVADMPFLSYQVSIEEAVRNAGRLMKEGRAHAVKLEGGSEMADTVRAICRAGIPVVGHIGLTPQSIHQLGGFKVQGKESSAAQKLLDDAKALEEAGAFAIVLECVPSKLAAKVTASLTKAATIGIGAGADCDGQVLVINDLLGMNKDFKPKFVKRFADLHTLISSAVQDYKREVETRSFPAPEHGFAIADDVLEKLY